MLEEYRYEDLDHRVLHILDDADEHVVDALTTSLQRQDPMMVWRIHVPLSLYPLVVPALVSVVGPLAPGSLPTVHISPPTMGHPLEPCVPETPPMGRVVAFRAAIHVAAALMVRNAEGELEHEAVVLAQKVLLTFGTHRDRPNELAGAVHQVVAAERRAGPDLQPVQSAVAAWAA